MIDIPEIVNITDEVLGSQRKRHIVGGILLSLSLFFGGLAITTITLKEEKNSD